MNVKRICVWFMVLILLCGILPCALAEQPESPAISFGYAKYLQNGFLYEPFDGSTVRYYDYAAGTRRILCTRPDCDHRQVGNIDLNDYHYSVAEFMNENPSLCYAARVAFASQDNAYVMYGNKLYYFPSFYQESQPGTNTVPLYVSEVDGKTRLLTDLGYLFPGDCIPQPWEMLAYDGYLYIEVHLFENPDWEGTGSSGILPGTIQLIKCSMDTGEASVLESFWSEYCDFHCFGLYDGILYYLISTASGMGPAETELDYMRDTRSKTRYSVQGINVSTGEKVIPDPKLCNRSMDYGEAFDIVRDGVLYSIILPETAEDNTALFLGYDLNRRETVLEYSFAYCRTDYYPYRVLTDEIMLAFNFETGTFALQNLKTGEVRPLSIPGACIYGNEGQTDWYDIFTAYFQTDPLVLDHRFSETEVDKAYVTAEELLTGNPQIHDFTDQ